MVHWDRKKAKQILLMQISGLIFAIISIVLIARGLDDVNEGAELQLISSHKLPLKELSGLDWRLKDGRYQLLAVGDKKAKIIITDLEDFSSESISFKDLMVQNYSLCAKQSNKICDKFVKRLTSDWESIKLDGQGRIFLLQEHSESIVVLDEKAESILHSFHVNMMEPFQERFDTSDKKFLSSSLGEGLVLLKNGHFIVAKEESPVTLIEFGPEGDDPIGLGPNSTLGEGEAFQIPNSGKRTEYRALAHWDLAAQAKCDFSDLSYWQQKVLVISQKCRQLYVYDILDPRNDGLSLKEVFSLPSVVDYPEAISVLPDGRIAIGSDVPRKKKNLHIFQNPWGDKR